MVRMWTDSPTGVTLRIGGQSAVTDKNGEFLLGNLASGEAMLEIDGRSANKGQKTYGRYFYQTSLQAGQINTLPQPIWLVKLDRKNAVTIPSPTTQEMVLSHPQLPGFEIKIPAGTVIRDADGKIVTEISLTPVPVDQTPVLMPYGDIPTYYTLQPGGARIENLSGRPQGVEVTYPNYSTQPPGALFDLFDHDPSGRGWYVYGQAQVSADGKKLESKQPFILYQFQSSSATTNGGPPPKGPPPSCEDKERGDPVDCYSGHFIETYGEFTLNDTLPL